MEIDGPQPSIRSPDSPIITPNDLREIREHIRRTAAPSWVQSVPSDLGDVSHGKLKADQWRSLACLYVLVPLMHLWHGASGPRRAALRSTFLLVCAIVVATSRTTSPQHGDLYLNLMTDYIESLKRDFPEFNLHPNHHFALHLRRYLIQYGPIHEWWTFPFERIIGMLQRISTNDKMGT